jgi:hypothetical protein
MMTHENSRSRLGSAEYRLKQSKFSEKLRVEDQK